MLLFNVIYEEGPKEKSNNPDIDENLIFRIGLDEVGAFEEFYIKTERILYAYVLSLTKNHDLTLDIMQDTYIKFLSAAHLYKPMGKPLAWIFTISKNIFYTKVKRDSRMIEIDPFELEKNQAYSFVDDIEDKIILESVLNFLSEEERQIVLLYAVSGMKHKEIAESLGLKLSTTLSKYHRAIKKLRDYIERGLYQ